MGRKQRWVPGWPCPSCEVCEAGPGWHRSQPQRVVELWSEPHWVDHLLKQTKLTSARGFYQDPEAHDVTLSVRDSVWN